MSIYRLGDKQPQLGENAWIAPNATVIGDVRFVSRQVVFYTTTLLAVGLYLLAISLVGYVLRTEGGNWGAMLQLVFVAGAGVVLLAARVPLFALET